MTDETKDPVHTARHDNHKNVFKEIVRWQAGRKEETSLTIRFRDDPNFVVHVTTWTRNGEKSHLIAPMLDGCYVGWREASGEIADVVASVMVEQKKYRNRQKRGVDQMEIVLPRAAIG